MIEGKKKLIISRATWARGRRMKGNFTITNYLLDDSGMKCCLGFAAEQLCSATEEEIKNSPAPTAVKNVFNRGLSWLFFRSPYLQTDINSLECTDLISINDEELLDGDIREKKITEIFANHDIEALFVD